MKHPTFPLLIPLLASLAAASVAQPLPGETGRLLRSLQDDAGGIADCVLEPTEQVTISSPIPGVVETIHVERGDRVRAGQPIAELQSSLEQAQVALREARVKFAERKLARNDELYREDLISEHELDEIRTELELARVELHEAQVVLAQKKITSPFSGVIVRRHQSPGQYVTNEPIVTLVRIDQVNAEVVLPAARLDDVHAGDRIVIEPEYPAGVRHVGEVSLVDAVVDPGSGTFGIRATLDNSDGAIRAGVHCRATLPERTAGTR